MTDNSTAVIRLWVQNPIGYTVQYNGVTTVNPASTSVPILEHSLPDLIVRVEEVIKDDASVATVNRYGPPVTTAK